MYLDPDEEYQRRLAADIARERAGVRAVKRFAKRHADELAMLWRWSDGCGGAVLQMIAEVAGLPEPYSTRSTVAYQRPKVSHKVRWRVFKRDGHKCCNCGADEDLTVDHITPRSKGGDDSEDNLQTLCRSCNSKKGNRQ